MKGATSSLTTRRDDPRRPLDEAELERLVRRAQDRALAEAEERIRWESGVDRLDVRLVHAAIVEMTIDGYPVSNPIGFTGAQVELHVFNAFAPMVHLGALQSVADALELELLGVIAEPYAVATCLDPGELGDAGAVFVDIGGGTTDVALVRGGGISGTKMLALGGRAFTKGLAERLGVSFADAERAKLAAADGPPGGRRCAPRGRADLARRGRADDRRPRRRRPPAGAGPAVRRRRRPAAGSIGPRRGRLVERLPFARRPKVRALAPGRGGRPARRDRQPRHAAGRDADGARPPGADPRRRRVRRRSRHARRRARDAAVSEAPAVIYLEADDEITTVVRRVRAADAQRVIVVAPGRSRATSSAVALRLLARAGEEAGREVALVGDALTRSLAAEAGLTAYATLDDARRAEPRPASRRPKPRQAAIHVVRGTEDTVATPRDRGRRGHAIGPGRPRTVRGATEAPPVVAAAARSSRPLLVLGLAGAALLPGATVTIDPLTEDIGPVPYVIEVAQPEQLSGTAEASATVTATGSYRTRRARDRRVVALQLDVLRPGIAGGHASSPPASRPSPRRPTSSCRGARSRRRARSRRARRRCRSWRPAPGPAANVGAEAIDTVLNEDADARLQGFPENAERRVTNPEATSGGIDETGTEITQADVDAAVEALTADLAERGRRCAGRAADAIVVQTGAGRADDRGPRRARRHARPGGGDDRRHPPVGGVDRRPGRGEPTPRASSSRTTRRRPGRPGPAPARASRSRSRRRTSRAARCGSTSRPPAAAPPAIDTNEVADRIAGLAPDEAEAALADLGHATVELWPGWVASVPTMGWRIEVRVAER